MTQRISHYELLEQLGEGGMGVVCKARDTRLQRFVALKFLPASVQSDPERMQQLFAEARIAAGLNHPNICTIYELGNLVAEDSPPYIAMEYLEGRTLRDCLSDGQMPLPVILSYAGQIAAALQAAHANGVIHRDIKPENIFVTTNGPVKILDFGLAYASEQAPTDRGKISGSGLYMSPEQYRADTLDTRTDIWSFGVVLYEMLAGKPPFHGRYAQSLLYSILNEEATPVTGLRPDAPPHIADLCHRCLKKQREDRPASIEHVITELRDHRDLPATVDAPRVSHPVLRWVVPFAVLALVIASWAVFRALDTRNAPDQEHIRIAILPINNLTGADSIAKWSPVCQTMLERNLSGHESFVLSESLSLNSLLEDGDKAKTDFLEIIRDMDIDYLVRCAIGKIGSMYQLDMQLVEVGSRSVEYSKARMFTDKEHLGRIIDSLSLDIAGYFDTGDNSSRQTQDLRPWITARNRNIHAEEAFNTAYQLIYEGVQYAPRKYLREALRLDSAFIAPRIWLAAGLWQAGDTAEARMHEAVLRRLYTSATAFERAMIDFVTAFQRDSLTRQKEHLEKALVYSPDNNIVRMNLSGVYYALQDFAQAERVLAPAIRNKWRFFAAQKWLARCQSRQKKFAEAYKTMELAVMSNRTNALATLELSCLARRAGKDQQAGAIEAQAVQLLKEKQVPDADIHAEIGKMLCDYDLYDLAFVRFDQALKLEPANVNAIVGLAEAKKAIGELPEALNLFQRALRIAPKRTALYKPIGDIYSERGRYDSARRTYQLYLKRDSTSAMAAAIRKKLNALGQ